MDGDVQYASKVGGSWTSLRTSNGTINGTVDTATLVAASTAAAAIVVIFIAVIIIIITANYTNIPIVDAANISRSITTVNTANICGSVTIGAASCFATNTEATTCSSIWCASRR